MCTTLDERELNREEMINLLKELSKKYRKKAGKKMPAELVLVGGASVVINYGFRNTTYDMDAMIFAASAMQDAIREVADENNLMVGWLNDDFKRTTSYTPRLSRYAKHFRTFSNVVEIRCIEGEYLIAMKMKAAREYKHDLSDIIGILDAEYDRGNKITFEDIERAVTDLYDGWDGISEELIESIKKNITIRTDFADLVDAIKVADNMTKSVGRKPSDK